MHSDEEVVKLLEDLKRLSVYTTCLLTSESVRPEALYPRKGYVYGQFIFSLSLVDGIITLAEWRQARSMVPLVRALWEGWLGVAFVYAGKSHVWTYYLLLQEELKNKKKRDELYAAGEIEDEVYYKECNKEAGKTINAINRRYKELPLIPNVIVKDRSLTRDISLKQKCQIIDHYRSLRANHNQNATTLVEWYDSVYSHLSGTAHVSVAELKALYNYDAAGTLHVDISGGTDRKYLASLLLMAYLHHYSLMKVFIANISTSKQRIPDDIKAARRRMTGKYFREL